MLGAWIWKRACTITFNLIRIIVVIFGLYLVCRSLLYITSVDVGKHISINIDYNRSKLNEEISKNHMPEYEQYKVSSTSRPKKTFLTIGIPSVRRQQGDYSVKTIRSLVDNLGEKEREEITIVVFLADIDNSSREDTLRTLRQEYQGYMDTGLIVVIGAPLTYYPSLDGLKRTYGHSEKQVKWRSKQNYDYAFLFEYCSNISNYYMQLEDDVVTVRDYLSIVKDFIDSQKEQWVCLEFSELGYIGKLYHSYDLRKLAKMMKLFYQEQPPDVTYIYFNILMMQNQRIIRFPTIFQHIGYHSSLNGKLQTLKDRYFDDTPKEFKVDNPPAVLYTNFTVYKSYSPDFAYGKNGYFWASNPKPYSWLLLIFDKPEPIRRIVVTSGSFSHPKDILANGVLEISPTLINKSSDNPSCANYISVGSFNQSGSIDVRNVTSYMLFDVFCVKITMTRSQIQWIIIREIAIFLEVR